MCPSEFQKKSNVVKGSECRGGCPDWCWADLPPRVLCNYNSVRFDLTNLGLKKPNNTSAIQAGTPELLPLLSLCSASLFGEVFVTGLVLSGSCYFFTHNQQQKVHGPVSASRCLQTSLLKLTKRVRTEWREMTRWPWQGLVLRECMGREESHGYPGKELLLLTQTVQLCWRIKLQQYLEENSMSCLIALIEITKRNLCIYCVYTPCDMYGMVSSGWSFCLMYFR